MCQQQISNTQYERTGFLSTGSTFCNRKDDSTVGVRSCVSRYPLWTLTPFVKQFIENTLQNCDLLTLCPRICFSENSAFLALSAVLNVFLMYRNGIFAKLHPILYPNSETCGKVNCFTDPAESLVRIFAEAPQFKDPTVTVTKVRPTKRICFSK